MFFFHSSFSLQAHEFVDEQIYEQNCLETALRTYPSRSPSVSSHDSSTRTCCSRKRKRNVPLPNTSLPTTHSTHQGPLQELSAIHIQCGDPLSHTARWNKNRCRGKHQRFGKNFKLLVFGHWNCFMCASTNLSLQNTSLGVHFEVPHSTLNI